MAITVYRKQAQFEVVPRPRKQPKKFFGERGKIRSDAQRKALDLHSRSLDLREKGLNISGRSLMLQGKSLDIGERSLALDKESLGLRGKGIELSSKGLDVQAIHNKRMYDLQSDKIESDYQYNRNRIFLGAASLGAQAFGSYMNYKSNYDNTQVTRARNEVKRQLSELHQSYRSDNTGISANGLSERYREASQKIYDDAKSKLDNDRQRELFETNVKPVMDSYNLTMGDYEINQMNQANKLAKSAAIETSINSAVTDHDINTASIPPAPEIVDEDAKNEYEAISSYFGEDSTFNADVMDAEAYTREAYVDYPKEYVDLKVQETKTRIYAGIITKALAEENPTDSGGNSKTKSQHLSETRAFFDSRRDEMPVDTAARLDSAISRATAAQGYLDTARDIYIKHDNYEDRIEAARKIKDAEESKAVLSHLASMERQDKYIEQQRLVKTISGKIDMLQDMAEGRNGQRPHTMAELKTLAFKEEGQVRQKMLQAIGNMERSGTGRIETVPSEYAKYRLMNKQELKASINDIAISTKLSTSDKKKFIDEIAKVNEGKPVRAITLGQKMKNGVASAGFTQPDIKKGKEPTKEQISQLSDISKFIAEIEDELELERLTTGKEPTPEKEDEIINKHVIRHRLLSDGEAMSGSMFIPNWNESYKKAVKNGEENTWLPFVEDPEIIKEMEDLIDRNGKFEKNDKTIRLHVRLYKLGLPYSEELSSIFQPYKKKTYLVTNE